MTQTKLSTLCMGVCLAALLLNMTPARAQLSASPVAVNEGGPMDAALLQAAAGGQAGQLRDLIGRGGNPSAIRGDGTPAILLAIRSGNQDAVKVLLDARPATVNQAMQVAGLPRTPLVEAIHDQPAMVPMLINAGADLHWVGPQHIDMLQLAIMSHHVDVLQTLVQAGQDPRERIGQQGTLLHMAAATNQPDMIAALIDLGVEPNQRDSFGYTPLEIAIHGNGLDGARSLLEHGAWAYPMDAFGTTALSLARQHITDPAQATAMVDLLIEHGAPANGKNRPIDENYLDAVGRGDLAAVQAALAKGADVNARRSFSIDKPLSLAGYLAVQHPQVLACLIEHGLDVNASDTFGHTALFIASGQKSNLESINLLISHGADIDAISTVKQTPLSNAVNMNQPGAVALLLKLGANPNRPGVSGDRLFAMAREPHHSKLLAPMLEKAGTREDPSGTPPP